MFSKNINRKRLLEHIEDFMSDKVGLNNNNNNKADSPSLFLLASEVKIAKPKERIIPTYDPKKENDIERLTADINKDKLKEAHFEYVKDFTKLIPIKVKIKPVAAIDNQLGIFIDEDVPEIIDGPIYLYVGELKDKDPNNDYTFVVKDKNGNEWYIDALKLGDLSRFFNHSSTCNLYVQESDINGKPVIGIYQGMPLKKGDQLLYDYGPAYKRNATYKLRFLDPSDNEKLPEEIYDQNKKFYANSLFGFDERTHKDFKLKATHWLLPEIITFIYEKDYKSLRSALKNGVPVDSYAYSYNSDSNNFCDFDKQQHLTPLMIACYLGDIQAINILLEAQADVDKRTLNDGFSALTMLLKGHANDDVIKKTAFKLLSMMRHPFAQDEYDLTFLHYAITKNDVILVEGILKIADEEKQDIFESLFNRELCQPPHADFDYCLVHGQFEILQCLLKYCLEGNVLINGKVMNEHIKAEDIFTSVTLAVTPLESLVQFQKMVNELSCFKSLHETPLLGRLEDAIKTKQELIEEPALSNRYEYTADYYFEKAEKSKQKKVRISMLEKAITFYQNALFEGHDRSSKDIFEINTSVIHALQKIIDEVPTEKEKKYYAYQLIRKIQADIDFNKMYDLHNKFDIYNGLFSAFKVINDEENATRIASIIVELFEKIERLKKAHIAWDKRVDKYGQNYNADYITFYRKDYEKAQETLNSKKLESTPSPIETGIKKTKKK